VPGAKPVAAVAVVQRLERLTTVEAAPGSQQLSADEKGQLLRDAAICSRMMLSPNSQAETYPGASCGGNAAESAHCPFAPVVTPS